MEATDQPADKSVDAIEHERTWRLTQWADVLDRQQREDWLTLGEVRERKLYSGEAPIYRSLNRTQRLDPRGVTVAVLHNGQHYPDPLAPVGILYRYPTTDRPRRDASEIASTKAAGELGLPIFVVTEDAPFGRRKVYLGWVEDWSDSEEQFLIVFDDTPLSKLTYRADVPDDAPFTLTVDNERSVTRSKHLAGRAKFRQDVLERYGSACPLSGVSVPAALDAAHLCDPEHGGTNDPRNGLPLSAGLRRAFDRHLFAIDPTSHEVVPAPDGPSPEALGIAAAKLDGDRLPHPEALAWRHAHFLAHWQET